MLVPLSAFRLMTEPFLFSKGYKLRQALCSSRTNLKAVSTLGMSIFFWASLNTYILHRCKFAYNSHFYDTSRSTLLHCIHNFICFDCICGCSCDSISRDSLDFKYFDFNISGRLYGVLMFQFVLLLLL